jgi:hypothetical protein
LAVELGKGTTNINIDPILCLVSCPHYDAYPNEHHLTSYPQKSRNGIYRNLPLCWQSFTVLPVWLFSLFGGCFLLSAGITLRCSKKTRLPSELSVLQALKSWWNLFDKTRGTSARVPGTVNVYSSRTGKSLSLSSVNQRTKCAMFNSYFDITRGQAFPKWPQHVADIGIPTPPGLTDPVSAIDLAPIAWKPELWKVVSIPPEKYEFVRLDHHPNYWGNIIHVPNHQPVVYICSCCKLVNLYTLPKHIHGCSFNLQAV